MGLSSPLQLVNHFYSVTMIGLLGFLSKMLSRLPLFLFYGLGAVLGKLAYIVLPARRRIARINIARCFPDLSEWQITQLLKQNFRSLGIGVLEALLAWFGQKDRILSLCEIKGLTHIKEALKLGRGVIIVGPHVMLFELGGRVLSEHFPLSAVYRKQNQGILNNFVERARRYHYFDLIPKTKVRTLLQYLSQNKIVAYLADQAPPKKRRVYVPWFGVPVATHTALSHIARLSGAAVLPAMMHRISANRYTLTIYPPPPNFGKESEEQDAICLSEFMERGIRAYPEQYFWVHRCFKKLPNEKINYYARASLKPAVMTNARYERLLKFFKVQKKDFLHMESDRYAIRIFKKYRDAKQFVLSTTHLRELAIDSITVSRFYVVPPKSKYCVVYRRVEGSRILDLMQGEKWNETLQSQLTQFIERLHQKGICSQNLRPENIILQPNKLLALEDVF